MGINRLSDEMQHLYTETDSWNRHMKSMDKLVDELMDENKTLKANRELKKRIVDLTNTTRRNLIITGIAQDNRENYAALEDKVRNFIMTELN